LTGVVSEQDIHARLFAAVRRELGDDLRIGALARLSGGASQETWSFDALDEQGARTGLILRRETPNAGHAVSKAAEFELLQAASRANVPVPKALFLLKAADGLGAGYVMERVAGETIPRKILRDAPYRAALPLLAAQCGEILARIHSVPPASLRELAPAPNESPAIAAIARQEKLLDALGEPHPAFELGLRWLREHAPAPRRVCLVHGDFRNGNLLIDANGVRAVLDWELAHVGDPMEDLGWLCVKSWRFGVNDKPVGGFGAREELFAAYEQASGVAVDADAVRFWEAYGNLKWGLVCTLQASYHLNNQRRSVELAALGRRACEMEWDLLSMIGQ